MIDHPNCDISRLDSIPPEIWKKAIEVFHKDIAAAIEVEELVKQKTIVAGADPFTVTLIDIEEVPVAYVPS
ncbi:hypothetical protein ACIQXV_24325 [Neobacillus sp. NPDC097160]|uniref:hypothetical protein n=1 Tax=Neobacillus sp. NPDC097160 TaxID=3364298 RepID=UPI0037FC444F